MGRAWRDGVIDAAIGASRPRRALGPARAAGRRRPPARGDRGRRRRRAGRSRRARQGQAGLDPGRRGARFPVAAHRPRRLGARRLVGRPPDDMFRLGTREAQAQVVGDSAPVDAATAADHAGPKDREAVARAIAAIGPTAVEPHGRRRTATPCRRLATRCSPASPSADCSSALAAEGLRGTSWSRAQRRSGPSSLKPQRPSGLRSLHGSGENRIAPSLITASTQTRMPAASSLSAPIRAPSPTTASVTVAQADDRGAGPDDGALDGRARRDDPCATTEPDT